MVKVNNKKTIVRKILLFIMLLIIAFSYAKVNAEDYNRFLVNDLDKDGGIGDKTKDLGNMVIGILQVVGTAAAIIMLVFVAIKYMSAAPDERANMKKGLTVYVVGAIMVFAATNIVAILQTTVTELNNK